MAGTHRQHQDQREHRFAADNLSAYLDGELTAQEDARVMEHLRRCESCREDAATLRMTTQLLRQTPRHALPRSFALSPDAVAEQRSYRRWSLAQSWLRAASAVVSVLLVLLFSGDVIMSQGWFMLQPKMAASAPEPMMRVFEAPAEKAKDVVVEKAVSDGVQASAENLAPQAVGAVPMITSVRPKGIDPEAVARAIPTANQTESAPVAKMLAETPAEAQPETELQPQEAPLVASSQGQAVRPMALPQTSSAPLMGKGGGGPAPEIALAQEAPLQDAPAQPEAMVAEARLQPTLEVMPVERAAVESYVAPAVVPEKSSEQALETDGDQVILMGSASEAEPTAIAQAPRSAERIDEPQPLHQSRYDLIWRALRSAALIAFGLLLILIAGLLVARQKQRD